MDDKTTVIEQSIEEMGNKSRKVIFFTLTHGVTLSTTVANLEKKSTKNTKMPQETSLATCCIRIEFSCSCIIKDILKISTKKPNQLSKAW